MVWCFFPFTHCLQLLSKCWLEFRPCSVPECVFGMGNCVFGGFCWGTRTWCHHLRYTKICFFATDFRCNLRLNILKLFLPLSWFICLQVGLLWSFPKVLQIRPMRWQGVCFWVVLYRHRIKDACVWEQGAQSIGGETSLVVICSYSVGLWQDRNSDQRIFP